MDAATLAKHLEQHLRVATFPVGIRPPAPGEPIPAKAKRPKQDLHVEVAICQAISFARRYGNPARLASLRNVFHAARGVPSIGR